MRKQYLKHLFFLLVFFVFVFFFFFFLHSGDIHQVQPELNAKQNVCDGFINNTIMKTASLCCL